MNACPLRSVDEGFLELALEPPSPSRLITLEVLDGLSGSPKIGADVLIGDPGATATVVLDDCC